MAYNRQAVSDNRTKLITFYYSPTTLFRKAQMQSQYHANANKDKDGNPNLNLVFSDDHKGYFDSFCTKALETLGATYVKVNHKLDIPYYYFAGLNEACHIKVTDYGFVKDTLLSVLDEVIEKALVDYVLYKWYKHIGQIELEKSYAEAVDNAVIQLRTELFQFLRKQKPNVFKLYWFDSVCVQNKTNYQYQYGWDQAVCLQMLNAQMGLRWSEPVCVQKMNVIPEMSWSEPVCTQVPYTQFTMQWDEAVCVQEPFAIKTMQWDEAVCVQQDMTGRQMQWGEAICVQIPDTQFTLAWDEAICVQKIQASFSMKWGDGVCIQKSKFINDSSDSYNTTNQKPI